MRERIYPQRYDADTTLHVDWHGGWAMLHEPTPSSIPIMLGLLTIIGDAVRGVPWGSGDDLEWSKKWPTIDPNQRDKRPFGEGVATPVLPELGSVWVRKDGVAVAPVVVLAVTGGKVTERSLSADPMGTWSLEGFLSVHRPATVIPSPTADGWRRLADEQPAEGQMCWWWNPSEPEWVVAMPPHEGVLDGEVDLLWQPVPPGVIPPPPADRDGGQS